MKILFIGDIVGRPGRNCLARCAPAICADRHIDLVAANAENAAGGLGATPKVLEDIFKAGVHAVTLGNHTWRKKELAAGLDALDRVVRPANYPKEVPGRGSALIELPDGRRVGIVNLVGRVFMKPVDCPFRAGMEAVKALRNQTSMVIVDMHAEATSEKGAMGWYLDGLCTAVVGTHTHIQTADERILPGGTAFITDVGMTGPVDSILGVERDTVVHTFVTGMPSKFNVAKGRAALNAVVIEADEASGKASSIERLVVTADW